MRGVSSRGPVARARALLAELAGTRASADTLIPAASELAGLLLEASERDKTRAERARERRMARLMEDPAGQSFTTLLTDRVYRSRAPERIVDSARDLLRRLAIPSYLPPFARLQLRALLYLGPFVPALAAAVMLARLRRETSHVVLSADDAVLSGYLARRREQGVRVNLNHLGEAVLGKAEAEVRLERYLELLARPDVESISVKLSSIDSQVDPLAFEHSLARLSDRLATIYRAALANRYALPGGGERPKLVNLDMEAHRDLELTLASFRRALERPELCELSAGAVLQAYLPEAAALQRELTDWARRRVAAGGAPIRLRIVKGANLLAESAEASLRGWSSPIFERKVEVDASYKKMVEFGCRPDNAAVVRLGIASHNVFDLALGAALRAAHGVEPYVEFELLEGMADPLERALRAVTGDSQRARTTLVYAPVVDEASMQTAIAYLMRRLDENTAPDNFLRQSFGMQPGDAAFERQQHQFEQAVARRGEVSEIPRRAHERAPSRPPVSGAPFAGEPDSDFTLADRRAWIAVALARERDAEVHDLALGVAGRPRVGEPFVDGFDPSRPGLRPYRFTLAGEADLELALAGAERAAPAMRAMPVCERAAMLRAVAAGLAAARGELIAAMVLDAGKRVEEADAEVSEAIDFARYYAQSFLELSERPELDWTPKGVTLITPPWNFPLAIPAGGAFAGLMAGNPVILKPALETVYVASRLARICWQAGVPTDALQLCACTDELGSRLIRDARVRQVVLTGATSTAARFRELRPGIDLMAETGGKNALIISALADRDLAIKDTLTSAFAHAGQKCSATSLLICEAEVYDDPHFLDTLRDAARSLPLGSAWELQNIVTPLIHPPRDALLRGLSQLEPGERWLLAPRALPDNPRCQAPAIKLDVAAGSFTHTTEFFGPLLAVMRARDLEHALELANGTRYGLTAGLHSLDEREQALFAERMQAGNLYVNRPTTGAIVRRQPFGGHKASSVGPGAKAGGPNYVAQLARSGERSPDAVGCPPEPAVAALVSAVRPHLSQDSRRRLSLGACSYAQARREHFAIDHDPSGVIGERNVFRYLACGDLLVRASRDAGVVDTLLACVAAFGAGADFELSIAPGLSRGRDFFGGLPGVRVHVEPAADAAARVGPATGRVRTIGSLEPEVARAAASAGVYVADAPVMLAGRIELLHYHREQSVSTRYHRYGSLAGSDLQPAPVVQQVFDAE